MLHNEPALRFFGAVFIIHLLLESMGGFPLGSKGIWSSFEFAFSVPDYWASKMKACL